MIGSLMSRLGAAEKLSIPQLQKAIQDGTLPAFVGVPLLQQKVQESKQAQMAAAGAGPQPSIAQQVMQEAQGIESARSNLPETYADGGILNFQPVNTDDSEHEYAGGGMIAFDDGGDVEEDDDSSEDYGMSKEEERIFASLLAQQRPSMTEEEAQGIAGLRTEAPTGQGIRPEAKAPRGIDTADFTEKIKRLESGGRHYDKQGNILTSSKGAEGIMQVMPHTQRDPGFGVMAARDSSPAELERVGIDYANAMLRKYGGNEKLAAMAYNWGPGNVDRWIAGGMKGEVPKETRQYASNFAHGGEVRHFDDGGLTPAQIEELKKPYIGYRRPTNIPQPGERPKLEGVTGILSNKYAIDKPVFVDPTTTAGGAVPYTEGIDDTYIPELNVGSLGVGETLSDQAAKKASAEKTGSEDKQAEELKKESSDITDYRQWLKEYGENIKKQKETDKYMALLAAGLGMMGGTSPHGMVNIGQGGMQGIQAALAAQKATGADERALMSGQLGLSRATLYDKMRRDALAQKASESKALQDFRDKQIALGYSKAEATRQANMLKARKQFVDEGGPDKLSREFADKYGKNWAVDPKLQFAYKKMENQRIKDLTAMSSDEE